MRRRISLMLFLLVTLPSLAPAQNVTPLVSPADRVLGLRAALRLDTAQTSRLRDLSRQQSVALGKATTTFLRAEADLVDASRLNDFAARRSAIEKRSKAAIDAEAVRVAADKDTRAILRPAQLDQLDILLTESEDPGTRNRAIWESQVAPLALSALPFFTPDSGNVRIAVTPLTAEIYIGDRAAGYGRVQARLPVGNYVVRFRVPGCIDTLAVRVEKGPSPAITHSMSCK